MGIKIALAGNPNCGKTTLFNALTGANQSVGNWPGVTVERKEGRLRWNRDVVITDLPGVYSLTPYTPEERVTRDYLLNDRPDAIINIVDGVNLERNLFLTTQLAELGLPVVIVLNIGQCVVGVVVDGVSDVLTLEREQLRPVPALRGDFDPEHFLAIGSVGKRMLILLDIEKFLAPVLTSETPTLAH